MNKTEINSPDTNGLPLVRQVVGGKVKRPDSSGVGAVKVLETSDRGPVRIVTVVLCHLQTNQN